MPCSKLYGLGVFARNKKFDWHILPQHDFDVPIVVVGNISAGGTGKTPHTEYIVEALRLNYHIAILSRGYKRSTKGFVLATPQAKPSDIGDEPYQMYHKFDCKITVAVCEDRVNAIKELLRLDPAINLIVLDDAFQHRYVKPTVSIVVTEYNKPLFEDHLLPYGRLRDPTSAINRADIVIASKCPEQMKAIEYNIFSKNLNLYPYQHLFFSRFAYQDLVPVFPDQTSSIPYLDWMSRSDAILAVAGIGNPRPFVRHIKSFLPRVRVNVFPDHHNYKRKDMELIKQRFLSMKGCTRIIITTEKDAVRMAACPYFPPELRSSTFYLPVKVEFASNGNNSFADILKHLLRNN